jgi:hypothetical protein
MKSLDFEIKIGTPEGRTVPVSVLGSPAGEGRAEMTFPYDSLALENRLQGLQLALLSAGPGRRRLVPQHEQAVQSFGAELFDALFAGDIRSMFDRSRQEAVRQSANLRIQLRFDSADMASLPWEFLYDARRAEYLCLSTTTPVVRYVELADPQEPLTVTPPLRLLAMAASPNDLPALDVEQERHRMEAALGQLAGRFELQWVEGQTWRDLQAALRRGPWHAFHFVGHGGFDANLGEGIIALTNDAGATHRLCATDLGRLLGDHHHLRLAVLNACEGARADRLDVFSSTAAVLVRRGTPAVVAMQYEITDVAAVELSRSFYGALAAGLPVDEALGEARKSVALAVAGTVEWGTPVLYLRAPDSRIFEIDPNAAPPPPPPAPPPPPTASPEPAGREQLEPVGPGPFTSTATATATATGTGDGGTSDPGRRRRLVMMAGGGAALLLLAVVLVVLLTRDGDPKGIGTFDLEVGGGDYVTHAVEVPRSSLLLVKVNPDSGFDPDVAVSTDADTSRELARYFRDAGYDRARFRGLFEDYGYDPDGMSIVGRVDEGAAGDQERLLITAPAGGPFEVVIASADGESGDVEVEVSRVEFPAPDAGDEYIDDLVEAAVAEDFLSEEALADLEIWGSIQLGYEEDEDDVIDEGDVEELSVTVPATVRWTDTELDLALDDEVTIQASGAVQDDVGNNPNQSFGPDGEPDPQGRHAGDPYRQFNHAALLAKIGEDGEPFAVGSSLDLVAEEEGRLYFGMNDSLLEDNAGEFQVDLEVATP